MTVNSCFSVIADQMVHGLERFVLRINIPRYVYSFSTFEVGILLILSATSHPHSIHTTNAFSHHVLRRSTFYLKIAVMLVLTDNMQPVYSKPEP